ncbi:putative flavin-containing monooxygenase [Ophiocordyceps camponoti-floridani]|uniref:Putative flavin-containing monooxygenase n=1 Tax=Ophiocordyceps camponoti-floridani TaxID=2030778 RepID=A0A8H4Q778_9HYPO|nr:putative flavin-containing monooxygenase [Ophiocordyceps camponoti-floridani]
MAFPEPVIHPVIELPSVEKPGNVTSEHETQTVIDDLNGALSKADYRAASDLFIDDGFWRDHLALTWRFRTVRGRDAIAKFLEESSESRDGFRIKSLALDASSPSRQPQTTRIDVEGKVSGIQAFLHIETAIGSGQGFIRIVLQHGKWYIFTLYTSLCQLRGYEEPTLGRRPVGVDHGGHPGRMNWSERRVLEGEVDAEHDLAVLIIGAGQGGLTAGARLKMLGLTSLIIDQNDRVGDNWRKRYRQLALHDPVWYDHLPYLPFPPNWPIFTPKDKLAQFFEAYANILELNIWMKSTIESCKWDERKKRWSVTVSRIKNNGLRETKILHPRHIIQATGHSGEKHEPQIKGSESFRGDRFCHSSEFPGARQGTSGKKAVIIGCCNSAHDIAQDYFEHGFHVTLIQRSSTTVVSTSAFTNVLLAGFYSENGPPVEDADVMLHSFPYVVLKTVQQQLTKLQIQRDHETLAGLEEAGFKVDFGSEDSGLLPKFYERGGGYYIDVGASKLIADGSIKIKQGLEVAEILPLGLRLTDGSELEADEIILATGYQNMESRTRHIFGNGVADRVTGVWGLNDEGEFRTMWQDSGHPGFWFHGSNLALCRFYSRLLALQIKGLEEGLYGYGEI